MAKRGMEGSGRRRGTSSKEDYLNAAAKGEVRGGWELLNEAKRRVEGASTPLATGEGPGALGATATPKPRVRVPAGRGVSMAPTSAAPKVILEPGSLTVSENIRAYEGTIAALIPKIGGTAGFYSMLRRSQQETARMDALAERYEKAKKENAESFEFEYGGKTETFTKERASEKLYDLEEKLNAKRVDLQKRADELLRDPAILKKAEDLRSKTAQSAGERFVKITSGDGEVEIATVEEDRQVLADNLQYVHEISQLVANMPNTEDFSKTDVLGKENRKRLADAQQKIAAVLKKYGIAPAMEENSTIRSTELRAPQPAAPTATQTTPISAPMNAAIPEGSGVQKMSPSTKKSHVPFGVGLEGDGPVVIAPEPKESIPAFVGLEGDGLVPKEEKVPGPREMIESDLGILNGKIEKTKEPAVAKDPAGEKRVLSFMNESLKNPEMLALREAAAAAELAYRNQEGGWRYVVRKATLGKIGGKKLAALELARAQAKGAWTNKLGEQTVAAIKMAEARAEEIVGSIDAKNAQGRTFAKRGLEKTLERYRGRIAHQIVMGEMTTLKERTQALQQEQWDKSSIFTKAGVGVLAWYNRQPTWKKIAYSSAALTGGGVLFGFAGVGAGAIATYGAARIARTAFSLTAGRVLGEGAAQSSSALITKDTKRAEKRQADMKAAKAAKVNVFKNAAKEAVANYRAERQKLGLPEPTADEIKKIEETVRTKQMQEIASSHNKNLEDDAKALNKDRRRSNLIKTVVTGGAGVAAFAGLEKLGIPAETPGGKVPATPVEPPRSGASAMTEPDVPPQTSPENVTGRRGTFFIDPQTPEEQSPVFGKDILGHAEEELELKQTTPADIVGPRIAPSEGIQGDNDFSNDPRNPYRGYGKNGFGVPATPDDVARKAWIEGGMIQDDVTGVDAQASKIAAPGEQDNVSGVDNATRGHWNYNGGPKIPGAAVAGTYPESPISPEPVRTPDFLDKVITRVREILDPTNSRGLRGTSAVVEPQVSRPSFDGLVEVKSGDNLSYILKDHLGKSGHLDGLTLKEADTLVGKYVAQVQSMSAAEKLALGFQKSDIGLVYPGDKLDLRFVNNENLYGKFVGEIKGGAPQAPSGAARINAAPTPVTEQMPSAPSPADIQNLSTRILGNQIRDIFSTRAFFLGPSTDGMAEFNRISWQRADTFVGDPSPGMDPTLNGNKAEALRGVLRQAQNSGLNLKNLSIRAALEKAAELEATRILTGGR